MKKDKRLLHNNWFLFKLYFKASPGYVIALLIEFIRNEVCTFLEFTIAFAFVLESVEFGRPFKETAWFLVIILLIVVVGLLYNAFFWNLFKERAVPKIERRLKEQLYAKAKEIDLENYDDPEYYNDYILAVSEVGNQINRVFEMLSQFITGMTATTLAGGYFLMNDPSSFLFIGAAFFGALFVNRYLGKLNYKIRNEKNPHERRRNYINRVFYLNDYAKEIRLNTEVSEEMLIDFDKSNDEILALDKKYARIRVLLDFLKEYIFGRFIIDVLYLAYLIYNAIVLRRISFSNVAVFRWTAGYSSFRLNNFTEVYRIMQETSLYMERILRFLETEPKILSRKNLKTPETPSILELKNVSFAYNEKDGYILNNINMTINPLSKIAIVGYNGAGKTTLTKLVMRLYDPDEGEILLDGVNIKDYEIEDYRRKIGTIFQDYKIFSATVKENVLLDFAENGEDQDVVSALEMSGFMERLTTLPNSLETNLTTEFEDDGVNLSGGEGQKLAVARVFYAGANLIILDEPSSALDPIAEYHLNCSMMDAAENKSVLFISHRLSTTRIADRIYMLEDGRIIEEGNHAELIKGDGKYAEMWRVQAGQYF